MRFKMRVVTLKNPESPLFFVCDGVFFDVFFAQVLSWENEQFIKVVRRSAGSEETIRFFDPYDHIPEWRFEYKGSRVSALYAFQFSEGDNISFTVRNVGGAGNDLSSLIKESYMRHYVMTHIYERDEYMNFPAEKQHAFVEALRADAREQIKKNNGLLLFRELERKREWKE